MKAEQKTQDSGYPPKYNLFGLQALRGICAILILIHHFGFQNTATDAFGDLSVSIFFILSGFVLTVSYAPRAICGSLPNFFRFITHRLISIYPLYIAGMIFMWYFEYRYTITRRIMLTQALLLQSHNSRPEYFLSANSPTWFVSDILFCYILFLPLLYLLKRPVLFRGFLCILFPLYFIVLLFIPESDVYHTVYISPLMQLPVFIIGMTLASHYLSLPLNNRPRLRLRALKLLPISILLLIIQIYLSPYIPARFCLASYWWPVSALLVYSISLLHVSSPSKPPYLTSDESADTNPLGSIKRQPETADTLEGNALIKGRGVGIIKRLPLLPILLFFGDISYPLFIFHYPYLHFTRRIMTLNVIILPPWLEFLIAFSLLILLSCILHHLSKGVKTILTDLTKVLIPN